MSNIMINKTTTLADAGLMASGVDEKGSPTYSEDALNGQTGYQISILSDVYKYSTNPTIAQTYFADSADEERIRMHDSGFAFLTTELAKLHEITYKPITHTTWRQDIPVVIGGGFVDFIEYRTANYRAAQEQTELLTGNNTNMISRVSAFMNQRTKPVYLFQMAMDFGFVDIERANKIRMRTAIQDLYRSAIEVGFDYFAQDIAYNGVGEENGLINNPNVKIESIPAGASGSTDWDTWAPEEIVAFFNGIHADILTNTGWNFNLLPDTYLLPPKAAKALSDKFSELYTMTIRAFLKKHSFGAEEAADNSDGIAPKMKFVGRPQLADAGTVGEGRMVAYKNDRQFVRIDLTRPLGLFRTGPNIDKLVYSSFFLAQLSAIQMPYVDEPGEDYGGVWYWDFS